MAEPPSRGRRYYLRTLSMLGACLATTTAGTVYLFSTYGPALSRRLGLTSSQSNVVSISANYGLLLSAPFFGWAADTAGPRVLSAFAAVGSFVAFSALAYTYNGTLALPSWLVLPLYMVLVGLSAQAANMAAVTTTTKNFKQNRGSAVSLCIAFFGLSPFVLSQANSLLFSGGREPDTFGFLRFLAFLGLGTSLLAMLSLSVVGFGPSRFRREVPPGFVVNAAPSETASSTSSSSGLLPDSLSELGSDEERGLAAQAAPAGYGAIAKGSVGPQAAGNAAAGAVGSSSATSAATAQAPARAASPAAQGMPSAASTADGLDYDTARDLGGMAFVRDPEAQLLALVLFLCAGIGVSYNNNIGAMANAMYRSSTSAPDDGVAQRLINHHVAVVSLGSFAGRLTIGLVADTCKRVWSLPRSGILVIVVFCVVLSQVVAGTATTLPALLVASALTGLSYGFMFGFMPTLVSVWFGTRHFGSNWGTASAGIGFSGQALGAFFGYVYDSNLPDQDASKCPRGDCYRDSFILSLGVGLLGLVAAIVLVRRRGDRRRENRRRWEAEEVDHVRYVPFVLAE
ncbi:hypothetical protein H4R18_003442 [Coemansia javaensis]|uniref:Major facilitator superfamily (MFS) profile domain-containing protein n=1 Tax=Coemansia javaensis TaxID=2761396 RepID=A0A9W8HDR5_9FUNG|nr:hypothetical protein H4R18_003442 [Coemansia javaensis]